MKEFTKFNVLKSDEYRSAWAKKLMCKDESEFTEDEKRELEMLKKDEDVKRARKYDKDKQYLYKMRWLKKKGQLLRESEAS